MSFQVLPDFVNSHCLTLSSVQFFKQSDVTPAVFQSTNNVNISTSNPLNRIYMYTEGPSPKTAHQDLEPLWYAKLSIKISCLVAMKEDVVHYKKYSTNELHNLEGVAGSRL